MIRGRSDSRSRTVDPAIRELIAEGGENFYIYLNRINISGDGQLIVLSSDHSYYYDESELSRVKTLINLKKLNYIKNLGQFLSTIFSILPPDTNFVGCFSDDTGISQSKYLPSRIYDRVINFLDAKPDHILNRKEVIDLLITSGFRIIDMTELGGLTYFYSKLSFNKYN